MQVKRVKDVAGAICWSFQGEKRPPDRLISIEKQRLFWTVAFGHLENRVSSGIAERGSITVASRTGQFAHFRVVTPGSPSLAYQSSGTSQRRPGGGRVYGVFDSNSAKA